MVAQDVNSLGKDFGNLFTNEDTSTAAWVRDAADVKAKADAANAADRVIDNNLDLSWHGVSIALVNQGGQAVEYSTLGTPATISKFDGQNINQRFKLMKVERGNRWSPWFIQQDSGNNTEFLLGNPSEQAFLTFSDPRSSTGSRVPLWYISTELGGTFSIKSANTNAYLSVNPSGEPKESKGLKCVPGTAGDNQGRSFWRFTRLPDEASIKAAAAVSAQSTMQANNLDPSWHETRVSIFSKQGISMRRNGKTVVGVQALDRADPDQIFLLKKTNLQDPTSPWNLVFVHDSPGGDTAGVFGFRTDEKVLEFANNQNILQEMQWRIGWDPAGGFRLLPVGSINKYLDLKVGDGDPDAGAGMELSLKPRKDGNDKNQQIWRIERHSDSLVDVEWDQIDKSWNNSKCYISPRFVDVDLDTHGGSPVNDRGYFGARDKNNVNERRIMFLERKDSNDARPPWKIRSVNSDRSYIHTKAGKPEWVIALPDKADTDTCWWRIRTTNVKDVYRIQNDKTKRYLEYVVENEKGFLNAMPFDISAGDRQQWRITRA